MCEASKYKAITEWAECLLTPAEVAMIIQPENNKPLLQQLCDHQSLEYRAYQAGYLKVKARLNAAIIKLAEHNSSPAQVEAKKLLKQVEAHL